MNGSGHFQLSTTWRRICSVSGMLGVLLGLSGMAAAGVDQQQCEALRQQSFLAVADGEAATMILQSDHVASMSLDAPQQAAVYRGSRLMGAPERAPGDGLPAHCHIRGYITPHVQFEMRLPVPGDWNGKFLLGACNGFCGRVDAYVAHVGILRGYAAMTTDGGHVGDSAFDSIWARNNMQARIDFAHRANHVAAQAARAVIEAYYAQAPRRAYITGCSKGGHAGVMAAQRYPGDFDGIIARGPTIDYTGVNLLHLGQRMRAVYADDGSVILGAHRHRLIMDAVVAQCDTADGLADGLISNPAGCDFDAGALQCARGQSGDACLNAAEVDALRRIYAPVRDARGNEIYPGTDPGSELAWLNWGLPRDPEHRVRGLLALSGYLNGFAFERAPPPDYDWRMFDWDRDRDRLAQVASFMDATHPDLRPFRDAGGKMIVLHGWSDEAVPASATIKWYEEVSAFMGGRERVQEFARLFLLPGVNHCDADGVGPSTYEALAALERWVEEGVAPDSLLTLQETLDGPVTRTRPVYPYPAQPRYRGEGSIDDAGSFVPYTPQ